MSSEHTDVPPISPSPDRLLVAFTGDGAGVEEMSWGQWGIWLSMVSHESWLPIGGTKPLNPGTTVQDIVEELQYLMSRFPSMRTRLRFDAAGRPTQELFDSGEITLEIYDAGDAQPEEVAAAVEARYQSTAFDFAADWPVRMAVVRHHDTLTHMVVTMCHLVADGAGAMLMLREVEAREAAPVSGMQQMEQARWQRSPAGQRQNAAALQYWEKVMRAIPPRRLPDSIDRRVPRHWSAEFRSPALRPATEAIAERTGARSSPIMMALFAVSLARITGINPVVVRPVVNNRFRPGLSDVVCQVAQNGICGLDVADITVDDVVRQARRAIMVAQKNAYYDSEEHAALVARFTREQGPDFDIACFFNDRRGESVEPVAAAPTTPERLREAQYGSTFDWTEKKDNPFERMFVHIDDDPMGIMVTVCADTHYFSPAHIEALARGMETIAVEAAVNPTAPTLVTNAPMPVAG